MRFPIRLFALLLIVGSLGLPALAQDPGTAIKALLQQQAADWNRGDLDAFATGYKNSPEILFMGATPKHGYSEMLAGYKARYPTREAMGTLTFSQLQVQPLDQRIATTTGNFHLVRSTQAGGNVSGYFLLVLEKTAAGWKIVCDDTTVPPAPK
jgi:ketosteroid isomerase-like protein